MLEDADELNEKRLSGPAALGTMSTCSCATGVWNAFRPRIPTDTIGRIYMITASDYSKVERQLKTYLSEHLGEVAVKIGEGIHYPGTNIVITCAQFTDWMAEQRYHHVVRSIPPEFYDRHLRQGVVWFELAPGESAKEYMRMPRSEDVVAEGPAIEAMLKKKGFAGRLIALLGPHPEDASTTHFTSTRQVLAECKLAKPEIEKACLYLISLGAYCDMQVLMDVLPKLAGKND